MRSGNLLLILLLEEELGEGIEEGLAVGLGLAALDPPRPSLGRGTLLP